MKETRFLEGIPDVLYKYRNWDDDNHKRIITNNELFFSSADLFNDPFDASLPYRYNKEEMTEENILKKLILVGRGKWPDISEKELHKMAKQRFETTDFTSDNFWRENHTKFKESINKDYGICSFTSKNDNLLMWSHYGNSHKGFCIGFDKYELYNSIQGMLGLINYTDFFPTIPMFDQSAPHVLNLLMTKSKHWVYEDEYRIVKSLASRKAFQLEDVAIKEIIFGCKIDSIQRAEIIKIAQNKSSKIRLFDAVTDDTQFKLNLVEI